MHPLLKIPGHGMTHPSIHVQKIKKFKQIKNSKIERKKIFQALPLAMSRGATFFSTKYATLCITPDSNRLP